MRQVSFSDEWIALQAGDFSAFFGAALAFGLAGAFALALGFAFALVAGCLAGAFGFLAVGSVSP